MIHGQLESFLSSDPITTGLLTLFPLQGSPKPQFIRVVPNAITGRRFDVVDPSTGATIAGLGRAQAWG